MRLHTREQAREGQAEAAKQEKAVSSRCPATLDDRSCPQ